MVIVRIMGGLGNQMFQYARALALSIERGEPAHLDISSFSHDPKRRFMLMGFDGVCSRMSGGQVRVFRPQDHQGLEVLGVEDDFRTLDLPPGNIYLNGYWQSEAHFARHTAEVLADFGLSRMEGLVARHPGIAEGVAVHVRRTDYLASGGYHPVQDPAYYEAAMGLLGGGLRPYVFSDDIEWCEANLNRGPFSGAAYVRGEGELGDLLLMSRAAHNVIANSSFSWWGAWLNRRPGRRVVAPRAWFGESAGIFTGNIVPKDWERI